MNQQEGRATRQGQSTRRGYDPLVAGISEGVAAGYQALEHVVDGFRESVQHRGDPGSPREGGGRQGPGGDRAYPAPPFDIVDDLATIFAEFLARAGEVAQATAKAIGERTWTPTHPGRSDVLDLDGAAGARAVVEFTVWNNGAKALKEVAFASTDLISVNGRIDADAVSFDPSYIERIAIGAKATVNIIVAVPDDADPGTYRGLVVAEPGGAWAVLELNVELMTVAPATAA
jgi:hypothetical protein